MKRNTKKIRETQRLPLFDFDVYSPEEIAKRVEQVGVKKIRLPFVITIMLGILGGGFISLGVMYHLVVLANPSLSGDMALLLSPVFYAMGYTIAFLAGAEVFTTNNLAMMGLASKRISLREVTVNWSIVFVTNIIGALIIVILFVLSGQVNAFGGAFAEKVIEISSDTLSFTPLETFIQGLFGNLLICSGIWIALAGRTVTDKILALLLPLSAVPAIGFQHVTGNVFTISLAVLLIPDAEITNTVMNITFSRSLLNLVLVALGNIVGGGVLIALVYYFVFMRMR